MKTKSLKSFLKNVFFVMAGIILLALIVALYHTFKPLPAGISYEGAVHTLAPNDVEFLYDLTYQNDSGSRIVEQTIFPRIFTLIDDAQSLIVIDAFLFNDDYIGKERLIPLTTTLKEKLIAKKKQHPNITILFITDEINNFYGSYLSDELETLITENITVVVTDLRKLRDSNPVYSGFWRTYLQWFGTKGSGSMKHPLGNPNHNVTIRAFLKLFNTKANHRKVFITDSNESIVTLVTSANPHEASSLHSNIALVVKRKLWRDALASELAVAEFSGYPAHSLAAFKYEEQKQSNEGSVTAQLLTEGKIKKALLHDIDNVQRGDQIDLAMFYLSDRDIVKALKRAAIRGVGLRLILDPNKDAFSREKNGVPNRQVGQELTKLGVSVRWYDTHGEQFHTKLLVIHTKNMTIVYGGSANYTRRNLNDLNLESVVRITAPRESTFVSRIESYFTRLWQNENGAYTLDFESYQDLTFSKVLLYRFQEWSGMSSF